jgi:hypothetical protein
MWWFLLGLVLGVGIGYVARVLLVEAQKGTRRV